MSANRRRKGWPAIVIQAGSVQILPIEKKHGGYWRCILPMEIAGRFIDSVVFVSASQSVTHLSGPLTVTPGQSLMFSGRGWR